MGKTNAINRRQLLRNSLYVAGGFGLFAMQGRLGLIRSALAASTPQSLSDYRSLVCINLDGGNDAFNMFVPRDEQGHANYASIRQSLAIPREQLLAVENGDYGFHPAMPAIRNLYEAGHLGLVANVGVLYEPVTREQILADSANLPPDLFSHSHQKDSWQAGLPSGMASSQSGWGGRMAELLKDTGSDNGIPPTFSLAGYSPWLSSDVLQPWSVRPWEGIPRFNLFNEDWSRTRIASWERILALHADHPLERQVRDTTRQVRDRLDTLRTAYELAPVLTTAFDDTNPLAVQLEAVAKLIAIREQLGMRRQIFYVSLGGWDTHGNQLPDHARLLSQLDAAMASFYLMTVELGVAETTLTVTASEFGRSLTSNGDGTDHAWGSHHLVMGGDVLGGRIHGRMPVLELGGVDDAHHDGRVIPQFSVDQYAATLARWMGLAESDIAAIHPHLNNFDIRDIGFLPRNDADGDMTDDASDNCPTVSNPDQRDTDRDGLGDSCDPDDDNDGMPDAWEELHGLDPTNAEDANRDKDRDGFSNRQEYEAGTDPSVADPDSVRRRILTPILNLLLND